MNNSKNQEGYALVIVLLMVVLFLGMAATFMAGSLNHAKQEQAIDTSNQSVASAEMGVRYYSADFQREISIVKSEIIETTQNRLKSIVECFQSGDPQCKEETELKRMEEQIDLEMKEEYITQIITKVEALNKSQKSPFSGEDVHYKLVGTNVSKLNAGKENINSPNTTDKEVNWLKIELELEGDSKGVTKYLTGIFTVEVPETFLSEDESLTIETTTVDNSKLNYSDVFSQKWPEMQCSDLKKKIESGVIPLQKDCLLGSDISGEDFADYLKKENLDPKKYRVFTENFRENACNDNCNSLGLGGMLVVVRDTDEVLGDDKTGKGNGNLNSLNDINLIVDGHLSVKNLNSLGSKSKSQQTLIFREFSVTSNVQGQGITNTNLVILGKNYLKEEFEKEDFAPDSRMSFQGNITIGDNGRVCFDLDKILPEHVEKLSNEVRFSHKDTPGQIIYYSSELKNNKFILTNKAYSEDKDRTIPYVTGYDNYTDFLSSCGVDVTKIVTTSLEIPYAHVVDPIFGLEVEY